MVYRLVSATALLLLYPFLLYRLFGMVLQERYRQIIYATVLLLAFIGTIGGSITAGILYPQGPADMGLSMLILGSYATLTATTLLLPHILFWEQLSRKITRITLSIASILQIPFLFIFFINPETWEGGPLPLFADRLPLVGILFDAVAGFIGTAGYDIWFTIALPIGLFIQMALISLFLYWGGTILMGGERP